MRIKSIRTTMLLITIPTIVIAMAVLSLFGYYNSRKTIQESIGNEMELCLSGAVENIEKSLSNNRKVVETLAKAVENTKLRLEKADYGSLLTSFIGTNAETFGGGIWFEPYAFEKNTQYFSPYCMRENGQVVYVDNYSLGDGVYYTDQDWYTNVTNTSASAVWSAPYFDDYVKISMVTASAPFYDKTGKLMGVATTDIDLTQLQKMVTSLPVHDVGRAFLIDAAGTYIADEDSEKLLAANILQDNNASMAALGKTILSQKNGSGSYTVDGQKQLAWFSEVPESGWFIVTTIPEQALMSGVNALGRNLLILCLVFALLASLILINFVKISIIRPLKRLAAATSKIAGGDLDVTVDVHSKNEIGVVSGSLEQVVTRLKQYISYIDEVSSVLDQIAAGNLAFQLRHDYDGEFCRLKDALLHIQDTLTATLRQIVDTSQAVSASSGEISNAAQTLSAGSVTQSASTEQISGSITEMSLLIRDNSQKLENAAGRSSEAISQISASSEKMYEMTEAMSQINEYSMQIQKIVKTVEDIAFQTNILALNAAVEAARAGVAGKGFAVVADEVRNLANKSGDAAKNTTELIENTRRAVENGAQIAVDAADSMDTVVGTVKGTAQIIQEISGKSEQQLTAIQSIDREIRSVAEIVRTNAAMSQESAAKSEELFSQSRELEVAAAKFKLANTPAFHK